MAKFRWTKDYGANWTVVEASLPYNIAGVVASDTVIVEPIGDAVTESVYEAEAVALFARMTTQPADARKTIINTLIKSLKTVGVWGKLDVLYLFAAHTEQAALLNWKTASFTGITNGSPTFAVDGGFTGNGTTSYINTQYAPLTDGVNFTLNNASGGVGIVNNATGVYSAFGTRSTAEPSTTSLTVVPYTASKAYFAVNVFSSNTVTSGSSVGTFMASRVNSTNIDLYRDGANVLNVANAATRLSQHPVYFLARNEDGSGTTFAPFKIFYGHLGAGLNDTEAAAMTAAINAYATAIGAI